MAQGPLILANGREITSSVTGFSCESIINGGFASASFTIPLNVAKKIPYLSVIKAVLGSIVIWEGVVEDLEPSHDSGEVQVTCFGWKRLLEQDTVKRIWSKRSLSWSSPPMGEGAVWNGLTYRPSLTRVGSGLLDASALANGGVGFAGNGVALASDEANALEVVLNTSVERIKFDTTFAGTNVGAGAGKMQLQVTWSTDSGASWSGTTYTASGSESLAISGANRIRIAWYASGGACTPTSDDSILVTNIRLLGTTTDEDDATSNGGGYYPRTLIIDLLTQAGGVAPSYVENVTSFVIPSLEREHRGTSLDVLQEISDYFDAWWGVFEDRKLIWKTLIRQYPEWVIPLEDATSWSAPRSIDRTARTVYVKYTDAATGREAEASATAVAANSPYTRWAYPKDVVYDSGSPMTANTATALAGIIGQTLKEPLLRGEITLPMLKPGSPRTFPYATVRPGDVVNIPELPRLGSSLMSAGSNVAVVVGVSMDFDSQSITLTIGDEPRTVDVLTARLLAVTNVITGS